MKAQRIIPILLIVMFIGSNVLQAQDRRRRRRRPDRGGETATETPASEQPEEGQQESKAQFSYQEEAPPMPPGFKRMGGIVGRLQEVADMISNLRTNNQVGAWLRIRMRGILDEHPSGQWTIRAELTYNELFIDPLMKEESQAKLRAEQASLIVALQSWSYPLPELEKQTLRIKGELSVIVDSPFELLELFGGHPMEITLTRPRETKVEEFRLWARNGEQLKLINEVVAGIPFLIEVRYNRAPEKDVIKVGVKAGDRVRTMPAQRTATDAKAFVTQFFYVWDDDTGIGPVDLR